MHGWRRGEWPARRTPLTRTMGQKMSEHGIDDTAYRHHVWAKLAVQPGVYVVGGGTSAGHPGPVGPIAPAVNGKIGADTRARSSSTAGWGRIPCQPMLHANLFASSCFNA